MFEDQNMPEKRILVMDDDVDLCQFVASAAEDQGVACAVATTVEGFFAELRPDLSLILLDLMMPEIDGIELLRLLGERRCQTRILLMSGIGTRVLETAESLARSHGLNVLGYLQKPFRLSELQKFIDSAPEPSAAAPNAGSSTNMTVDDADLRSAVQRDEFILHYQPQIEILTGEVIGVEALVRWHHPVHGLIYPDSFIARCERLELIDLLGTLVADRGLSEIGPLMRKDGRPLSLSLNISPFSLLELSLPDTLLALTLKHKRKPEDVVVEVVESALVREESQTLDVLTRLRMKGFQLSVDDFGTGYSMMEQLRNIPATEIKIDRTFVKNLNNRSDRITVLKTIEIGHALDLKVVAEGVETPVHLEFLRAHNCDAAQGYLFAKPMPLESLKTWLDLHDPGASL
jgi:EAL domain-containing protein (putative c-di-GMP-specific phosphodiesterase class I)/ActR/RegA family two-component response regulator